MFRFRVLLAIATLGLLVVGGWSAYGWWLSTRTEIAIQTADGTAVDGLTLEFFGVDESPVGVSPGTLLSKVENASARTVVTAEQVPGEALVRVRSAAHGATFGVATLGAERPKPLVLGRPVVYSGRVRAEGGEGEALPGARVFAFGGGSRGVILGEAVTAADGAFQISGISDTVLFVTFRVFADGYAVFEKEERVGDALDDYRLRKTAPVRGRVQLPADATVDLSQCEIRVMRVPGVVATLAADGSFEVDSLPPSPTKCRLVVSGLVEGYTHRRCFVVSGERDVVIEIEESVTITGTVANAVSGKVISGANVYHEHGPNGSEVVECSSSGRYTIRRVPRGIVRLRAERLIPRVWMDALGRHKRNELFQGFYDLQIEDDMDRVDDVVLMIQR